MEAIKVSQVADELVRNMNHELSEFMNGHCVFINCPLMPPLDDEFRVIVEQIQDKDKSSDDKQDRHLVILLETQGGYMETVERMVSVMRKHYDRVSFVIPNFAYSAGTVLVLSGDDIYMDYYSVLGPIDPQEPAADGGRLLPGVGYLAKFKELTKDINASGANVKKAELTYLVKKFDPARLFRIEQSIEHGRSLISTWLPKYKFKDWTITETKKNPVDNKLRVDRAKKIAKVLGNAKKWHSHGRGITMNELMGEKIKLKIEDFGKDEKLSILVRRYHGFCIDHFTIRSSYIGYIHSKYGVRRVI